MAFKSMSGSSEGGRTFKTFAKMANGEAVTGYFIGLVEGRYGQNMLLETEQGQLIELAIGGDLKYKIADAVDPNNSRDLLLNVLTQVVCLGKRKIKNGAYAGRETTTGDILQDIERVKPGQIATSIKGAKTIGAVPTAEDQANDAAEAKRRASEILKRVGGK